MTFLVFICLAALLWLLWLLRRDRISLGLPIAYMYSLLLIHLPGAFAHIVGRDVVFNSDLIEMGMGFTALGSMCFVRSIGSLVPRPKNCQSIDIRIANSFGGFACSAGSLICTVSVRSTISRVSALQLIRAEGFGCWA